MRPQTNKRPKRKDAPETKGVYPHKPNYNVRQASQSYSSIATVLAGFALAAIILIAPLAPDTLPTTIPNAAILRDWATVAFLVSFFGCVLAAFAFAVVSGEEELTYRSNTIALLAGVGFSTSAAFVFWGIATLLKVFLTMRVANLVIAMFPIIVMIQPLYLALSAFDNKIGFEAKFPTRSEAAKVLIPSYLPLVIAIPLKYLGVSLPFAIIDVWLNPFVEISLAIIMVSNIWSLYASNQDYDYNLKPLTSGVWIGVQSLLIALLILAV